MTCVYGESGKTQLCMGILDRLSSASKILACRHKTTGICMSVRTALLQLSTVHEVKYYTQVYGPWLWVVIEAALLPHLWSRLLTLQSSQALAVP